MKDLIRMNQLAGIITEGQAKKMMAILNEAEDFKEGDMVFIKDKGEFEIKPRQIFSRNGNYYSVSGHIKRDDGAGYSTQGGKEVLASDIKLADT